MKLLVTLTLALIALINFSSATPQKYLLSKPKFEEELSDHDMHPELPVVDDTLAKLSKKMSKNIEDERTSDYWMTKAKEFVLEQVNRQPIERRAKNIIMFLGDGLSHPTVAATRVLKGGEAEQLSFEKFPYVASSTTYCVDKQVADSACSATAYLTGVKANDATIGLSARARLSNCQDSNDLSKRTESIASWAMKAGKDAGLVTTTRVTHASPSGVYGHVTDRDWEYDGNVRYWGDCDPEENDDLAEQLIHGEVGKKLKVIMGGGSRNFKDSTTRVHGAAGYRTDGKDLIEEYLAMDSERTYVSNKEEMMALNPQNVKQVLGLYQSSHMDYHLDTVRLGEEDIYPSLKEMTEKAIDILSQNDEGYFLFVEGGRIDHGHHDTRAKYALDETLEFSKAIEAAVSRVNINETLIVVTADHSHVMTLAGYAARGADIFGNGGNGQDGMPYFTLSYANGPGFSTHRNVDGGRVNPNTLDRTPDNFRFPATVPLNSETHGGDDVGIWAIGPYAHLFQGVLEQNVIPHIMSYAACIGEGLKSCDE